MGGCCFLSRAKFIVILVGWALAGTSFAAAYQICATLLPDVSLTAKNYFDCLGLKIYL